jgi:hypothetical protein
MPHEFRNLATAPRETLGNALIAGGVAAIILLLIMAYFLWRDRKLKRPGSHPKSSPSRTRKKRRR